MNYLILDYETRSEADLKKVGGYEYAKHPSTQILCVAWKFGTKETLRKAQTRVWSPGVPGTYGELKRALCDPEVKIVAHNAFFEQVITRFVLTRMMHWPELRDIPVSRWICTAAHAAALSLPRNLEGACAALKLSVQKDMTGNRLVQKYCKPRKPTKDNPAKWHSSLSDLKRIMQYCVTDVDAETELFLTIPELNPIERKVWELDQKINWRGIAIDRPLVQTVLKMIDEEVSKLTNETMSLTRGEIETPNRRAALLQHLQDLGAKIPDLKSQTVAHALKDDTLTFSARRLLEIRRDVSRTSTAKYLAFEMRSRTDSRVRDLLMYHGASTGRWTGRGVQPQNFPRGSIKDTALACEVLAEGDLELVRMVYGNPMEVFASCLRGMIRATV